MTKRLKKKTFNACIDAAAIAWNTCSRGAKLLHSMALGAYGNANAFLKNFSLISTLLTVSIATLLISLTFGPFKVCEFLTVCWLGEALWIWFRGECI